MNGYETQQLDALLSGNRYPGRGIVMGNTPDGKRMAMAYFIMGRSANSRNRIFARTEDGIRTEAADAAKLEDPSLIIYHPLRKLQGCHILTNGDQTDTIRDAMEQGSCFEAALFTREFEPDAPNFTPRISAILRPGGAYTMAILKRADEAGSACARQFFCYPPLPGVGHFLHTYVQDGSPLPSYRGEPQRVAIPAGIDAMTAMIWDSLDEENKIALYVSYLDLESGEEDLRLVNKYCAGGQG